MNPIHIAFCVNDSYAPYIIVAIRSVIENNRKSDVCIHVLTDYISEFNHQRLFDVVDGYKNVLLQIHLVDDTPLQGVKTLRWTIYAWYRLLLPMVLPDSVKQVLYLDADTLVVADISELFNIDMTGKAIAAVIDSICFSEDTYERCGYSRHKQYICSGVMLMNLDFWREYALSEKVIRWSINNDTRLKYPDQDAINVICEDLKILLPIRYNVMHWYFVNECFYQVPYIEQLSESICRPVIIHYANCSLNVKENSFYLFISEWIKYNKKCGSPVKRRYESKGWMLVKRIIWEFFHPYRNRCALESVKLKIATQH